MFKGYGRNSSVSKDKVRIEKSKRIRWELQCLKDKEGIPVFQRIRWELQCLKG